MSGTAVSAFFFVVYELFPGRIAWLFTEDPMLYEVVTKGLKIYMSGAIFSGFQSAVGSLFQAMGCVGKTSFINIAGKMVFRLPVVILLTYYFGVKGVWLIEPIIEFLMFILTLTLVLHWLYVNKSKFVVNRINKKIR